MEVGIGAVVAVLLFAWFLEKRTEVSDRLYESNIS